VRRNAVLQGNAAVRHALIRVKDPGSGAASHAHPLAGVRLAVTPAVHQDR
jgi:hypothetical protein